MPGWTLISKTILVLALWPTTLFPQPEYTGYVYMSKWGGVGWGCVIGSSPDIQDWGLARCVCRGVDWGGGHYGFSCRLIVSLGFFCHFVKFSVVLILKVLIFNIENKSI